MSDGQEVPTPAGEGVKQGTGGEEQQTGTPPVEEGGAGQEETPASGTPAEGKGDPEAGNAPDDAQGLSKSGQEKVNKRINKLVRKNYDLMSENDRLKASGSKEQKPNNQTATDLPVIPKFEDFDDVDEYNKEMAEYSRKMVSHEIDQRDKTRTEEATQKQKGEQRYKSIENFETKSDEYRKNNSDFDKVAKSKEALMIYGRNSNLAIMVQDSEVGPELAHYLGGNLGVLDELASMSVQGAAREIGKLEARIEQSGNIKQKTASQSSNPINPVKGGQGVVSKEIWDLEGDDFDKARRAQIAKRNN